MYMDNLGVSKAEKKAAKAARKAQKRARKTARKAAKKSAPVRGTTPLALPRTQAKRARPVAVQPVRKFDKRAAKLRKKEQKAAFQEAKRAGKYDIKLAKQAAKLKKIPGKSEAKEAMRFQKAQLKIDKRADKAQTRAIKTADNAQTRAIKTAVKQAQIIDRARAEAAQNQGLDPSAFGPSAIEIAFGPGGFLQPSAPGQTILLPGQTETIAPAQQLVPIPSGGGGVISVPSESEVKPTIMGMPPLALGIAAAGILGIALFAAQKDKRKRIPARKRKR